jgi:hypothetical protein
MTKKSKKSKAKKPSFQMIIRSDEYHQLFKSPMALLLMVIIAERAKKNALGLMHNPRHQVFTKNGAPMKLEAGQCLLGDCKAYGMTLEQYRQAKKRISALGLVDFKSINGVGTIATILNANFVDLGTYKKASES